MKTAIQLLKENGYKELKKMQDFQGLREQDYIVLEDCNRKIYHLKIPTDLKGGKK